MSTSPSAHTHCGFRRGLRSGQASRRSRAAIAASRVSGHTLAGSSTEKPSVGISDASCPPLRRADRAAGTPTSRECGCGLPCPRGGLSHISGQSQPRALRVKKKKNGEGRLEEGLSLGGEGRQTPTGEQCKELDVTLSKPCNCCCCCCCYSGVLAVRFQFFSPAFKIPFCDPHPFRKADRGTGQSPVVTPD